MHSIAFYNGNVNELSKDILLISFKELAEITQLDAQEIINIIYQLDSKPKMILLDNRTQHSYSYQCIKLLINTPSIAALAIWVKPGANAISASTFMNLQPAYPVKTFYLKNIAIQWLQAFNSGETDLK